jgi:hypothetical protein
MCSKLNVSWQLSEKRIKRPVSKKELKLNEVKIKVDVSLAGNWSEE